MDRDRREPKSPLYNTFGARLRDRRRQAGLTQQEVARDLEMKLGTYALWERGIYLPRVDELVKLAGKLEVAVDDLLGTSASAPAPISARGVSWRLAWSSTWAERDTAANVWRRLVDGEEQSVIAGELGNSTTDLESLLQDLILSESLVIEKVPHNEDLGTQLREQYVDRKEGPRLHDVLVADYGAVKMPLVRYALLGHLAKRYFIKTVKAGNSVGLCGGVAVSQMVHAMKRGECPAGIRVLPIAVTPVFEKAGLSANSTVSALAFRHFDKGVQASELSFVFRGAARDRYSPPLGIAQRILEDAARVDFAFMGIGSRERGALTREISAVQRDYQWLAKVDVEKLDQAGRAVGDVLYHLVDAKGKPLADFKERNEQLVCSIGLDGLGRLVRSGKRVVVIAAGEEKADVTHAAIVAGYANVLIVDEHLANGLLRRASGGRTRRRNSSS
jgi:DNA-binding transcriptional regulator LsrR (DeoR family)/DNA-binding XRE family transcriptional regulator